MQLVKRLGKNKDVYGSDSNRVPDLKKNLIPFGALDSNGCKYTAEGGMMKVSKGALVVMKGKRVGNFDEGSTVKGGAAVTTEGDEDQTLLWHMRLAI